MKRSICLLLLCLLLSGCGLTPIAQETEPTPAQTELPERRGQQTIPIPKSFGLAYVPDYGFNPYQCLCITNRPVFSLVYESLFVLNNSFQPEPVLCDRFAVSEAGTTYRITLCAGVYFSDGSPLTAADVAASLEAAKDSPFYGSRFANVVEISPLDTQTLEISLMQAYENLPLLLDVPIVKAGTQAEQRPLGTGPYVFSEAQDSLCLRRNRSWWREDRAPVEYDTILLTVAKDTTAVRDSFEFGDTSLVCADLNAPNAVGYRCDYELWDCPTTTMVYLGFNLYGGIMSTRAYRRAATHLIDRERLIVSVFKGFGAAAYLPCAPDSPLYDRSLAALYGYDEAAATQGIREAGLQPDTEGTLLVNAGDPAKIELARSIAQAMTQCGLPMEVVAVDAETYAERMENGMYDAFIGETRLSGNFDLTEFFRVGGSLGYGGICSYDMEQLCAQALENSGNCYDLFRVVMENAYFCPLLFKSYAVMANRGTIASLQPAVDCVFHLPGGRSLADASVSYEELIGAPEEEETTEVTEERP